MFLSVASLSGLHRSGFIVRCVLNWYFPILEFPSGDSLSPFPYGGTHYFWGFMNMASLAWDASSLLPSQGFILGGLLVGIPDHGGVLIGDSLVVIP